MRGPYERVKWDLRRVWECPDCQHRERLEGTVTSVYCRCQRQKQIKDQVVMRLVDDQIRRAK